MNTWFTVTGVLGTLIILNSSLVAAATMIREKERGTLEQLLMTPASPLEIVAAKIVPLFVLLMGMALLALTVARLVFHLPFRGSVLLVLAACGFCALTGIGIGTFVSHPRSHRQSDPAHDVLRQSPARDVVRGVHPDRGHCRNGFSR